MTAAKYIFILIVQLLLGCNGMTPKVTEIKLTEVKNDVPEPPPPPPPILKGLRVAAVLVYADSTTSTFDILNDKSIALWNTIIGAGDAEKPSESIKIILTGKLDSLTVTIYNGKKKVVKQTLPVYSGDYELYVPNTGCDEVNVRVTKLNKVLYHGNIPFKCGE